MDKSHKKLFGKNMNKHLFMQEDLRNNFYFKQFFIQCSFVYTIIEILNSTSPGPASSPIGRSMLHTANQNGGDLYPSDDETGQDCNV
jgi:hypothetical protein